MHFTEDDFENAILELFREQLGYDYVYSPNVIRDYAEPLYVEVLEAMLPQINRGLPQAAIDEAMVKIRTYEGGTFVVFNRQRAENGGFLRQVADAHAGAAIHRQIGDVLAVNVNRSEEHTSELQSQR